MEKFNDVFDKAKQAVDIACKKTGEIVNTEKKKFNIAAVKNERDKLYLKLGKTYFDFLGETEACNDAAKSIVAAIKNKTEEIERLEEEMYNSKEKVICKNCKKENLKGSAYCSKCGMKLD